MKQSLARALVAFASAYYLCRPWPSACLAVHFTEQPVSCITAHPDLIGKWGGTDREAAQGHELHIHGVVEGNAGGGVAL